MMSYDVIYIHSLSHKFFMLVQMGFWFHCYPELYLMKIKKVGLSIYLSSYIYVSIGLHVSIYLSICLHISIYLSVFMYLSICLSVFIYLSIYRSSSIYLSVFMYLSICLLQDEVYSKLVLYTTSLLIIVAAYVT